MARGNLFIGLFCLRNGPLFGERDNKVQLRIVALEALEVHLREGERGDFATLQQRSDLANSCERQILHVRRSFERGEQIIANGRPRNLRVAISRLLNFRLRRPRMKHIRRRHIVPNLQRANLRICIALVVQPVEHHLLLLGRERPHACQLRGLVQHFVCDLRERRRLGLSARARSRIGARA